MNSGIFDPFVEKNGVVILDGAMATELEKRGADLNHALWSAKLLTENPNLIKQVHLDYLQAGADIITTASYQASFTGFFSQGFNSENYFKEQKPLIAASVGPYGASLADGSEYRGDYGLSVEELMSFHRARMKLLSESGAELLACETIPCPEEAIALIRLLKEFPGVQAWLSYSCKNDSEVCSGAGFAECVALANESEQVVAVGLNCTAPQFVESLVTIARNVSKKHVLAYPNKGEIWDAQHKSWQPALTYTDFVKEASRWLKAGATLIGGCCRSSPEDIKNLRSALCN
jgi:homocysteine S-methyltransferase